MADKKLNQVSTLTDFDYALVVKGNDVAKVSKQQLAEVLGGLFTSLQLFPFMYRGRIDDADLAVENGWYEIVGNISNAPFSQSWGPLFVVGNSYKVQFAVYSVSNGFKLYVRQLNHASLGWAKIDLTQV